MSKRFSYLKEIAVTKDSPKNINEKVKYLKPDKIINPGPPKRAGIDATETVNKLYFEFIKR